MDGARAVGSISKLGKARHFEGIFFLMKNGVIYKKGHYLFTARCLGALTLVPPGFYIYGRGSGSSNCCPCCSAFRIIVSLYGDFSRGNEYRFILQYRDLKSKATFADSCCPLYYVTKTGSDFE